MNRDLVWGGYPRISDDPHDKQNGIGRQREDITEAIRSQGGDAETVVWYPENDTSAYKKRRVQKTDPLGNDYWGYRVIRPVWHQALHDMRTGRINALMVWDLDRLARDPRDLEDAIEVVQYYGGTIKSATAAEIDLTTDAGISWARMLVVMGAKASADTSRRVKREHEAAAKAGIPRGSLRPFGWQTDKRQLEPKEAALLTQAAQDLIAGRALRSVVREINDRGVLTSTGRQFNSATLKQTLLNPRIAGWRTSHREIVMKDGQPVRGQWEPILDQDTYDRLVLVLKRPDTRSRKPRRGARHYLMTGILRCGICNSLMYGNKHRGDRHYYVCNDQRAQSHGLAAAGQAVDRIVSAQVFLRLADAELVEPEEAWDGQARIDEIEGMIREAMAELRAKPKMSRVIYAHVEALEDERAQLEARRAEWLSRTTGPSPVHMTAEEWGDLETDEKRAHIEKHLDAVVVAPATRRGNQFDPERISYVWKRS